MRLLSTGLGHWVSVLGCAGALACSGESNEAGAGASPPTFEAGAAGMPRDGATNGAGGARMGLPGTPVVNGAIPQAGGGSMLRGQPAQAGGASAEDGGSGAENTGDAASMGTLPSMENMLVLTGTTGLRHNSAAAGVQVPIALGDESGFAVGQTEEPALFSDTGLLSTTS